MSQKRMKKNPFCCSRSSTNVWIFNGPLHPAPFQKCSGLFLNPNIDGETCTAFSSVFFGLVTTQKQSLGRALTF